MKRKEFKKPCVELIEINKDEIISCSGVVSQADPAGLLSKTDGVYKIF